MTIKMQNILRTTLFALAFCMAAMASAQSKIYYAATQSLGTGDGSSWANVTTLAEALQKAVAGDQIWVQGFETITGSEQIYVTPSTAGFTLKSGVQLYGGFAGTEKNINERETLGKPYQMKYRTLLTGDIGKDDVYDNTNLIFPANGSRADNATHVLTLNLSPSSGGNNNNYPTVVNGLSIGGGQADGTDEYGGGILVTGDNTVTGGGIYRIERCLLTHNYAVKGGGIYVAPTVKDVNNNESLISLCAIYNNAAGVRSGLADDGGGAYLAGAGKMVNCTVFNNENGGICLSPDAMVINCTVTRNSGGGIDMTVTPADNRYSVFNTVIWGNSKLYSVTAPRFRNSAYYEATAGDADGNVALSRYNYENNQSPYFESPSSRTGFDRDFNWESSAYPLWSWTILDGSALIDKGDNTYYSTTAYGSADMDDGTRISNSAIDIGACEFQYLPASRIRYVKTTATGSGDGSSWDNASDNIQNMIDELAENNPQNQAGEVWVAAGTYEPQTKITGADYSASFRMRDGISVYGGFSAVSPESSKQDRQKGDMPWNFTNRTILQGSFYMPDNTAWNETNHKWNITSDSRHVVWFAPLPSEGSTSFNKVTTLNGVTIRGGNAQGNTGVDEFLTDRGGGVYMGINAYLEECVVTENTSVGNGGGICLEGGRVLNSLVYNNNADGDGGGVYIDNAGIVLASMLSNNSAANGAGIYMSNNASWSDGLEHPEYMILSTSVVSNNTGRQNGAVYCDRGGVVQQNTIVNNYCPTGTDNAITNASQTGGLYVNEYVLAYNNVIWNNIINTKNVPIYARNPTADKVRFFYNGMSGTNNSIWNNTLQQEQIDLSEENISPLEGVIDPEFDTPKSATNITADNILNTIGVQYNWRLTTDGREGIDFYWEPITGSNLRARGMILGAQPAEVLMSPELDIANELFAQKPSLGAFNVDAPLISPNITDNALAIYIDADCTDPTHDGSSWAKAYRSFNEALAYLASLGSDEVGGKSLQIHVLEGDLWPRYAYTNLDPKTATIDIPVTASGQPIEIYGGYRRDDTDGTNNTVLPRAPMNYRSILNGNHVGKDMKDGLYHCITVAASAKVVIDGFHVINGYAAGEASRQYGAGLLVHDGAEVTVRNCVFENNTALEGAAIDARNATLTMNNCVVNNNTNTTETAAIINCPNLTMNHVTVVNNKGAAPADMGTTSFSAGNSSGTNSVTLASEGADGAKIFANPTNGVGATLGFDTYLGGYSEFRPLTSSTEAANALINKATGTPTAITTDITALNGRDLGGIPDRGAYEALLPEAGSVIYVTATGAGNRDGSSWENAIAGNNVYDMDASDAAAVCMDVLTTNSKYAGLYNSSSCPYGETSNHSKTFLQANSYSTNYWNRYINITNNRKEQYVSGLQYAVEKASTAATDTKRVQVWVAGGTYTDWKGFVIRDKVEVYGGFPNEGSPNENDREALLSQYVPANTASASLDKTKYETILQVRANPTTTWNGNEPTLSGWGSLPANVYRKPVLFQPDVCVPTKSTTNNDPVTGAWFDENSYSNTYRYNYDSRYVEYEGAVWDGFTIRHGYYKDYFANRDGGAGVRMFRGVTLRNCVVTLNTNYSSTYNSARNRGGGIYCDGENSYVINCFVLNNYCSASNISDCYGGGMYMILGTGYNLLVANNYAGTHGGGIYIEAATFYNNTIAYNNSQGTGGLHQYFSDQYGDANLYLYNCLFYGNSNAALGFVNVDKFNGATNCYIQSNNALDWDIRNKFTGCNYGTSLSDPFEQGANAQSTNNYRLNSSTWCLNNGTEAFALPETDVDFTDRIKDCKVDIGAYERSNQDNVKSDADGYYYVNQNGVGTASGESPQNAACAMKLQEVLYAAGERVQGGQTAVVKIAGYEGGSFTYHANTLSDPDDPQSYTFVVPEGVTVEGGYKQDFTERNPKLYNTILSPVKTATSTTQEVNGYHAVTFKAVSVGQDAPTGQEALKKTTVIDGLYLIDGMATSMAGAGNPKTRGGGAIVPAGAHVRNCVIAQCEAIEGGGLYILPGGMVSGSLIAANTAETGAGVFADNTGVMADRRAHLISCTVSDNTASSTGGGIYLEEGAIMVCNSVVWGNSAPSDKNISGPVSETYADALWAKVFSDLLPASGETAIFFPFNNCYVETYEMPTNIENMSMTSEEDVYFASTDRTLKVYSPLIKHGPSTDYYAKLESEAGVSKTDMQGLSRRETGASRVDVGAYAFKGGVAPTDQLITRLFVSKGANTAMDDVPDTYIGRSFYTAMAWVDDALEYIRKVRENGLADDKTQFEILVAEGTYKPSMRRAGVSTEPIDQRQNSYVIPHGVSIYGGFSGTEKYSSGYADRTGAFTEIANANGTVVVSGLTPNEDIKTILARRAYSDFNQNNILEPWEFENQTILSGNINVSTTAKNVYHVLYSDASTLLTDVTPQPVVLDGLTIKDGETDNVLSNVAATDEKGRGGGIYSNGVSYVINRCRLVNNFAVRGGAVYVRDARLTIVNSMLAGNGTVDNPTTEGGTYQPPRGGAVYVAGISSSPKIYAGLYAVNTLWVNNETSGQGGAIGTNYADGLVTGYVPEVSLMNNTFALNKAGDKNPVIYHHNSKNTITNTLMWGNEGTYDPMTDSENNIINNSASDAVDLTGTGSNNIKLSTTNLSVMGPRFAKPSTVAGVAGYDANNLWNPVAISILTDGGDGTYYIDDGNIKGGYTDWMKANAADYATQYMGYDDYLTDYLRYSGPLDENGKEKDKPIDIGFYEYQYVRSFPHMDAIYVATTESGLADGSNWANATSNLRDALSAMANPQGGENNEKAVYIKAGEYSLPRLSSRTAYTVSMGADIDEEIGKSLTIRGSYNESGIQDFSQPTVITTQENNAAETDILMQVSANKKPVTIDGLTFINKNPDGGIGVQASSTGGLLKLQRTAFRGNRKSGISIVNGTAGSFLFVNTLFADGGTGLADADSRTTVVNATFANNQTDLTFSTTARPNVYNSVSWKNVTQNLTTDDAAKNVAIEGTVNNDDITNGPNFRDPENTDIYSRDYRIRPSLKLLNKGSNDHYIDYALGLADDAGATIPADEKDLANGTRLVDNSIDVGAYEYEAALQPIVYVKADLTGAADGTSWATALGDLQGAVDLAGLYAYNKKDADGNITRNGYVFVHGNYHDTGLLNLTFDGAKVYGGMNDERSNTPLDDYFSNAETVVNELLGKRKGLLEATNRSSLNNVTIAADNVVDGFLVTGTTNVNKGMLSTSIVEEAVTGTAEGWLYNTLVTGDGTTPGNVSDVKAVNVTATGSIENVAGSANNRDSATADNTYVPYKYWNYQLMETSEDIDGGTNSATQAAIGKAGHDRDIAGNKRLRYNVDNGCFETWNICKEMTADNIITATDCPADTSVVYVRKGLELKIENDAATGTLVYGDEASAFTPGFLLLEHQAGLRGNGNHIRLTNFAVEREIPAGGADLIAMPFDVNSTTSYLANIKPLRYDGNLRAAYEYKYDGGNSTAWTSQNIDQAGLFEGLLFENKTADDVTLRFNGKSSEPYIEDGTDKTIELKKYNFNEAWTTDADGNILPAGSNRFTHKENMSWNLFGSPYLCSMNYGDLAYGRVLYGYENGAFKTIKTYNSDDGTAVEGHIPAGSAVFTQTATLKDTEIFTVAQPADDKDGSAFASANRLAISLWGNITTRNAGETDETADVLQLGAVEPSAARSDFDIASDGVKWTVAGDSLPLIYAERAGGRYSMLSAVNREAEVAVGVALPAAGRYTIGIPATADTEGYSAVVLKDAQTGRTTDLLNGNYDFVAENAGETSGRFTITFTPADSPAAGWTVQVKATGGGRAVVSGTEPGDIVTAYNTAGMEAAAEVASGSTVNLQLQAGVFFFRVSRGTETATVKAVLK